MQKLVFKVDCQCLFENCKVDLVKIVKLCWDNVDVICEVINQDFFCWVKQESVLGEIIFVINDVEYIVKYFKQWMKLKKVLVLLNLKLGKVYIWCDLVGVVGIVVFWNYFFQLVLVLLVVVLGVGCWVMFKLLEYMLVILEFIKILIGQYFDEDQVVVIIGGFVVGQVFIQFKFDYFFYIGLIQVG